MSLIHEALRKARRGASEEERRGVVYAHGLTGRRRRSGVARGIALGAIMTLLIAGAVGGVLWVRRTGHEPAVAGSEPPPRLRSDDPIEPPAGGSPEPPTGREAPAAYPASATEAAAAGPATATATPPPLIGRDAAAAPGEPRSGSAPVPSPTPRPARPGPGEPAGERIFDVEADLGYAVLSLDYIAFRATDPFAEINGREVRVGSTIEGFTVEAIGPSSVRLRDSRGPLVLRVP